MKFSKSMEELMVPEWSSQYIQYKVGKKLIKTVTADINSLSRPNPTQNGFTRTRERATAYARDYLPHRWSSQFGHDAHKARPSSAPHSSVGTDMFSSLPQPVFTDRRGFSMPPVPVGSAPTYSTQKGKGDGERLGAFSSQASNLSFSEGGWDGNRGSTASESRVTGSHHPHHPHHPYYQPHHELQADEDPLGALMLPDPIQPLQPLVEITSEVDNSAPSNITPRDQRPDSINMAEDLPPYLAAMFPHGAVPHPTAPRGSRFSSTTAAPTRPTSTNFFRRSVASPRPFVARVSSFFGGRPQSGVHVYPDITDALVKATAEFQKWLLMELNKIENFYRRREVEAVIRFDHMKEQLEILRLSWLKAHSRPNAGADLGILDERLEDNTLDKQILSGSASGSESISRHVPDVSAQRRVGWKTTIVAMTGLNPHDSILEEAMGPSVNRMMDAQRDYEQRKPINSPTYRLAKSKLKRAFIEYYRRLELLRSYIRVNREAFGKITKKFDKVSGLRTSSKFINVHVNKSYFGGSDNKLDDLINESEILFARFFMKSNRKEAALRLRTKENKSVYHSSYFRSGLYLGSSLVIGLYALVQAGVKLHSSDTERTTYLLQLWGGIFVILLQVLLFAVNLRVWARNKINYAFIFEFDAKYQLDHRQFLEIPALFTAIFVVCFWFCVYDFWPAQINMIHFPIIYISVAGAMLFNPVKRFYFRSRKFFLQTLARLLVSGLKRVEFRDFWMSDLLCSQTYALGNISLFFCLYANSWNHPDMCNSSHSRLMGFFTTLPSIWRLLQCLRRFRDSHQAFPHLANAGKYLCTVFHYMMLSFWRIDRGNNGLKAGFMAIATINSFYTIFWDIVMDWSLLNPYARWPFVRDAVGFKKKWVYYIAMFADPILRFSWVFYIIYSSDNIQHSAMLSFILALLEVIRRFIWCFFRIENEHVGNVGANRAYRDPRLPYRFLVPEQESAPSPAVDDSSSPLVISSGRPTVDVDRPNVRRRHRSRRRSGTKTSPAMQALERLGRTMTTAHRKDYERKNDPAESDEEREEDIDDVSSDEEDDFYARTAGSGGSGMPEIGVRV